MAVAEGRSTRLVGGQLPELEQTIPAESARAARRTQADVRMSASPSFSPGRARVCMRACTRAGPDLAVERERFGEGPAVLEGVEASRRRRERRGRPGPTVSKEGIVGAASLQARPQTIPVPRGLRATCGSRRRGSRAQPRGFGVLDPSACTPSTHTSARDPDRPTDRATGSFTPVDECTHVSATTRVRGSAHAAGARRSRSRSRGRGRRRATPAGRADPRGERLVRREEVVLVVSTSSPARRRRPP